MCCLSCSFSLISAFVLMLIRICGAVCAPYLVVCKCPLTLCAKIATQFGDKAVHSVITLNIFPGFCIKLSGSKLHALLKAWLL